MKHRLTWLSQTNAKAPSVVIRHKYIDAVMEVFSALLLVMFSAAASAASTTGPIAVLDFALPGLSIGEHNGMPYQVTTLDTTANKVKGTLKVFQNPPLKPSDGSLDLDHIWHHASPSLFTNIELKRRGSSSISHPKKNYSLDFKGTVEFLGMPAEQEWVLHSCWADKTCLRNVIGYWQAAKFFPWAPRTEFVEVFINGDYRGLYVAVEKIKHGPNRVNLPVLTMHPNGAITGTFILKRDGNDEDYDWRSSYDPKLTWWFVSPKWKDLDQARKAYIRSDMDLFEAWFSPGSPFYDPWWYDEVMDERSAADFVIIQELANNVDAYWKSMYITRHDTVSPPLFNVHMGPIWDLDLAFGNYDHNPEGLCSTTVWRMETGGVFQPLRQMWNVASFRQAIYERWRALRNDAKISRTRIENKLDAFAARIANARARDNHKWDTIGKKTWVECWNKPTFQDEVTELKKWIRSRIDWMDKRILESRFLSP